MHKNALSLLFLNNGIFVFAASLIGPLYGIFAQNLSLDVFEISLTTGVFFATTTFFSYCMMRFGDVIKNKWSLLLAGFLIRALAWFLFLFVNNFLTLVLVQILLGFGEAIGSPAFDVLFAENLEQGKHMGDYAEWKIIGNVMTTTGTILGGLIVTYQGFSMLFIIMGFIALASSMGIFVHQRS